MVGRNDEKINLLTVLEMNSLIKIYEKLLRQTNVTLFMQPLSMCVLEPLLK